MARLSRQTKEIIKTTVVLLLVAALLYLYMIYPLNRVKAMWGRKDIDTYKLDLKQLPPNDRSAFDTAGVAIDTFRVESDGSTSLAGIFLRPEKTTALRGTVVLVPDERSERQSLAPLAKQFIDSGFSVVAYDQRATGLSSGKYHGDGEIESGDLDAIIGHLGVRNHLTPPVVVIGWKLGGDAAICAARDEKRISGVVAIEPYLTSRRQVDAYRVETGTWWVPLYRTVTWFWYNIRSGYGASFLEADELKPVGCRTIIITSDQSSPAMQKLSQDSGRYLALQPPFVDRNKLVGLVASFSGDLSDSNPK